MQCLMKQILSLKLSLFKYKDNMEEGKLQAMSNIEIVKLKDGIERYYIDTYEKLYLIVNKRFKEQKEKNPNAEPIINFARLIISLDDGLHPISFWIGNLCGKIEGITNLGKAGDLIPNKRDVIIVKDEIQFEVKYKITFANSIIYLMQFWNTKFLKYVTFHGTQFLGSTYIQDSIFFDDVDFEGNDINKNLEYVYKLPVNFESITFKNNIFKKSITFYREDWDDGWKICFSDNTYEGNANFIYCSIQDSKKHYYNFTNSIFKGNVMIDCNEDSNSNTPFSQINFWGTYFYKELNIINANIQDIYMRNCHFDGKVNITLEYNVAGSNIDFSFSTINDLLFIDSNSNDIIDLPINLSKEISFEKSLITKDAFILIKNINNGIFPINQGCLNFEYANILGTITIQDTNLKEIKLDKSTLIGHINIENVNAEFDKRESIAKIKNEYLQRNDIVNLLFYKAKEMKYYSEHLDFKYKFITNVFRWFTKNWFYNTIGICFLPFLLLLSLLPFRSLEKVREYTLLYLNRISNCFGMSWGQGVLFTCVTALLFFILINTLGITSLPDKTSSPLFVWGWNGWNSFSGVWQNYLRMFYLTKFEDVFNTGIKLNAYGETLFFVSKIFVSYGIYQTISAFRKYGK